MSDMGLNEESQIESRVELQASDHHIARKVFENTMNGSILINSSKEEDPVQLSPIQIARDNVYLESLPFKLTEYTSGNSLESEQVTAKLQMNDKCSPQIGVLLTMANSTRNHQEVDSSDVDIPATDRCSPDALLSTSMQVMEQEVLRSKPALENSTSNLAMNPLLLDENGGLTRHDLSNDQKLDTSESRKDLGHPILTNEQKNDNIIDIHSVPSLNVAEHIGKINTPNLGNKELTEKYAPYILPGDQTLEDARIRLKTAIEQTRQLRVAFTKNLYDKYRIVLRPVPKSGEAIIAAIISEPKAVFEKLLQENHLINTEKEIERKIVQKLNAEIANLSTTIGVSTGLGGGLQGIDNAEQLSWYGVGLYLVVLPEEDFNVNDLAADGIVERGPIDPSTGMKSKEIAQAAAIAASSMLDRVRKGAELRKERLQRHSSSIDDFIPDINMFPTEITSSNLISKKSPKMEIMPSRSSLKTSKSKPSGSLRSLLNLSANTEGVRPHGKLSASGFALNALLLKSKSNRTKHRHPFPQSKGARSVIYGNAHGQSSAHPFSLPSLSTALERKRKLLSSKLLAGTGSQMLTNSSWASTKFVLNEFITPQERVDVSLGTDTIKKISGVKRKIHEIQVLNTMRNELSQSSSTDATDPCLVLAVIKSLGLLSSSRKVGAKNNYPESGERILELFRNKINPSTNSLEFNQDSMSEVILKRSPASMLDINIAKPSHEVNIEVDAPHVEETARSDDFNFDNHKVSDSLMCASEPDVQYVPNLRGGGEDTDMDKKVNNGSIATVHHPVSNSPAPNSSGNNSQVQGRNRDSSQQVMASKSFPLITTYHQTGMGPIPVTMQQLPSHLHPDSMILGHDQRQSLQISPHQMHHLQSDILRAPVAGMTEYLNGMHQMQLHSLMNQHISDWSSLPSHHGIRSVARPTHLFEASTLALPSNQAAMFTRDRTAQVLPREQHLQAQVSVHQHNASAYARSQASLMSAIAMPQYNYIPSENRTHTGNVVQQKAYTKTIENYTESTNKNSGSQSQLKNDSDHSTRTSSASPLPKLSPVLPAKKTREEKDSPRFPTMRRPSNHNVTQPILENTDESSNNTEQEPPSISPNLLSDSTTAHDVIHSATNHVESGTENVSDSVEIVADNSALMRISNNDTNKAEITGMIFVKPSHEPNLSDLEAEKISTGYFYEVENENDVRRTLNMDKSELEKMRRFRLEYLLSVSSSVPVPKNFVMTILKEKLSLPTLKQIMADLSSKSNLFPPTEIIVSIILTWIWKHYDSVFEIAFKHSGRVDVDPRCIWVVKAAVESVMDESVLKELTRLASVQASVTKGIECANDASYPLAIIMSRALNRTLELNFDVDVVLSNFDYLIDHLDNLRKKALCLRSQERVFMATLMARRVRMSEAFSNAYTSAMIRAGYALGYDELGEIVQDEETFSFSMLPFDILNDSTDGWEDPGRPLEGYSPNLDCDELEKIAHAKAMIQRSLKKLQDRYNIKGGTSTAGPYSDVPGEQSAYEISTSPLPRSSPKSGTKRKSSSFGGESSFRGFDASSSVFNPGHFSLPLNWDHNKISHSPYGRHDQCISLLLNDSNKRQKIDIIQSTEAIDWNTIASMFEDVINVEKPSSAKSHDDHHNVAVPLGSNIIAPFCRKCDGTMAPSDDESDYEDENLDEEHILSAHNGILGAIKDKFDTMMRIRQEYIDRTRRHSFGRT